MSPSVLYLHGFTSSPTGEKATRLRELLTPRGIRFNAPDLNVPSVEALDFDQMVERALDAARVEAPEVVVGSSLGSLVALEVIRRGIHQPAVLIAPALGVAVHWIDHVAPGDPVLLYEGTEDECRVHRRFFEGMKTVTCDDRAPATEVTIFMGREDESVPFEKVREVWEGWAGSGLLVPGSRFVEIEGGDHSLAGSMELVATEIQRRAGVRRVERAVI
ncbi:MAG TPA: YqiA/YcfP family alpha/beta fold hydrolase [Thermoanaerobaculia bacterium]|nr:YqiA/YcfP family alpha/beta fold hydrolase [Thermoanaerobaculia bacterium]